MVFLVSVMLSKLKTYALAILGAVAAFGLFMWQMTRANFKAAELKGQKAARDTERKAVETMIDGMEAENDIKKDNTTNRDNFLD